MIGAISNLSNRIGGFIIPKKIDNTLEVKLPSGCKILCSNCQINNESLLISNGSIRKITEGYDILNNLDIIIIKDQNIPLTIIRGREILYLEGVTSDNDQTFYLLKGMRVNNIPVDSTGEFTISVSNNYLIEF